MWNAKRFRKWTVAKVNRHLGQRVACVWNRYFTIRLYQNCGSQAGYALLHAQSPDSDRGLDRYSFYEMSIDEVITRLNNMRAHIV